MLLFMNRENYERILKNGLPFESYPCVDWVTDDQSFMYEVLPTLIPLSDGFIF
jgi:hypothetical protein